MPYKDPEKKRESARRARQRDPERFANYGRQWRANLTPEKRAELNAKQAEWMRRNGRVSPEVEYVPMGARVTGMSVDEKRAAFQADLTDERHGTLNGYNNLRCRCDGCRAANAASMREYKERRRAFEQMYREDHDASH